MIQKEGLYLGWWWSQARGPWWVGAVVRRRGAGRPTVARKAIGVADVLRLRSDGLFFAKKET